MNIEKVKEALNLAMREHNDLMRKADLPTGSKVFEEAIAELESPTSESEIEELARALDGWNRSQWSFKHIAHDLCEYWGIRGTINFEEYHAKQCARCMSELDDVDRAAPRFPETRSGITTDVDK